jgi:NAD(P)-dependent dehydrogenase (short-subunit alcohol dehydrogenase family)
MEVSGKSVVVTGAASGIGRALAERFAQEGARLVLSDRDGEKGEGVARGVGAVFVVADVAVEADVRRLVDRAVALHGAVDLYCSNAGIFVGGGEETPDAEWRRMQDVNVMAHVYATRALLPSWLARGEGYFLATVSAAGLLSQIGSASYSVTKHAALAFTEWLALTYGDRGVRVSALCPEGVRTAMLNEASGPSFLLEGALEAAAVADVTLEGLRAERFLILPHPRVAEFVKRKAEDPDRWLRGMQRLRKKLEGGA